MTTDQQKSQIINKRELISLELKGIFCFQSSSKYFSPILHIFNNPGRISLSKGNQSPNFYKSNFLGD